MSLLSRLFRRRPSLISVVKARGDMAAVMEVAAAWPNVDDDTDNAGATALMVESLDFVFLQRAPCPCVRTVALEECACGAI